MPQMSLTSFSLDYFSYLPVQLTSTLSSLKYADFTHKKPTSRLLDQKYCLLGLNKASCIKENQCCGKKKNLFQFLHYKNWIIACLFFQVIPPYFILKSSNCFLLRRKGSEILFLFVKNDLDYSSTHLSEGLWCRQWQCSAHHKYY